MSDSKKVLKWVGIGCGGVALLACLVGGGCVACIYTVTGAPADAGHAFFADLRTGNDAGAYARMSETYRAAHTLEQFQAGASMIPALRAQTDSTFSNRSIQNTSATVSGTLTTATGDVPVTVTLSNVGGTWWVDTVLVQGMPLP